MSAAYLDNCATTKVCDEAAAATLQAMTSCYGNPSSLHRLGVEAEAVLRGARFEIAQSLCCEKAEIYFTSGGTEANNLAILGAVSALRRRGKRIVTTMVEHSSVIKPIEKLEKDGFEVIWLRPNADGCINEADIFSAVNSETILVSIMLVNNETGAIMPVAAARRAVKAAGAPALIHCDAVQAFGKLKVNPLKLGVDLLTLSAHKIHAPKGAGALYISKSARINPLFLGGEQEKGIRPGTEPVPAIAGFGEAARLSREGFLEHIKTIIALKDHCIQLLSPLPYITFNSPIHSASHILNVSVKGIRSETMLHYLEAREIYISSGSACGKGAKSHVLTAMGMPQDIIDSALRISFSHYNTNEDIERLYEGIIAGNMELVHRSVV